MSKKRIEMESFSKPHALGVDDTRESRTLIGHILRMIGFRTTEAVDGEEAWGMIKNGEFDVVVSDYEMPRRSGTELLATMRASAVSATRAITPQTLSSNDRIRT